MLFDLKIPNYFFKSLSYFGAPIKLNSRISTLGHELRKNVSYNWDGMKRGNHEFILWQFTLSGHGCLEYGSTHYDLYPGDAMLVHVPHAHRYYLPSKSPHWGFIFMILGGIECCRICRELESKNGPVSHYSNYCSSLETVETIFKTAVDNAEVNPMLMSELAYKFCLQLTEEFTSSIGQKNSRPPAIAAAIRYILRNFESPIGIADISEAAGFSRFHFSRLFLRHMGEAPGEFLRKLRLEKVIRMLQSEQLTLKEIAGRSGFQSASYLCRAFQQVYGMSPGKFRDINKLSEKN